MSSPPRAAGEGRGTAKRWRGEAGSASVSAARGPQARNRSEGVALPPPQNTPPFVPLSCPRDEPAAPDPAPGAGS